MASKNFAGIWIFGYAKLPECHTSIKVYSTFKDAILVAESMSRGQILWGSAASTSRHRTSHPTALPPTPLNAAATAFHHAFLSQFGSVQSCCQPVKSFVPIRAQNSPCTKLPRTLLPVCSNGCPTTICRKRCRPSRRCSITSSENLFVKT